MIQLTAKISLRVEADEFGLGPFKTPLRYTDKLAFVLVECTKTTRLRDNDLKINKRSLPFEEYMAVHAVVCSQCGFILCLLLIRSSYH